MSASNQPSTVQEGSDIVFLVGMPRSGTTLLVEHLARHPDVIATPETHFFRSVCRTPSMARKQLSADRAEATYIELSKRLRNAQGVGQRDAEKRRVFASATSLAAIARTAFRDLLAETKKTVLIEKTPDHGFFTDAITAVFPEARFIFLVRDPRDVALSWLKVPWNPAGILWPGIKWGVMARNLSRRAGYDRQHFIVVRYEDLLTNPERILRQLMAFLQLRETRFEPSARGTMTFDPDVEHWKARAMQPLDPSNRDRWRMEMIPAHLFLFDRLLGRLLDHYGYERADISFGAAGPAKIAAAIAYECYLLLRRTPVTLARRLGYVSTDRRTNS